MGSAFILAHLKPLKGSGWTVRKVAHASGTAPQMLYD